MPRTIRLASWLAIYLSFLTLVMTDAVQGAVIASTNFDLRSVSGATASNLNWVTNGVTDPGSLTTNAPSGLFDTTDAQNRFVPNRNVHTVGPWNVSIPLTLTGYGVSVEDVSFGFRHYNASGAFGGAAAQLIGFQVQLFDSGSTLLGTASVINQNSLTSFAPVTLTFPTPLELFDTNPYSLVLTASSTGTQGVNVGIDNLSINGDELLEVFPVPEPASGSMLYLLSIGLLRLSRRSKVNSFHSQPSWRWSP